MAKSIDATMRKTDKILNRNEEKIKQVQLDIMKTISDARGKLDESASDSEHSVV